MPAPVMSTPGTPWLLAFWPWSRIASNRRRAPDGSSWRFGDPDVGWRDHDGPREKLGYRGGAMLAFHADVELRRQGRPGLLQLIADRAIVVDLRQQAERFSLSLALEDPRREVPQRAIRLGEQIFLALEDQLDAER